MTSIIGIITAISGKKTGEIPPPTKIEVTNDLFQSKKPNRQVSFITLAGEKKIKEDSIKGFCHRRFKADFVVKGLIVEESKIEDFKIQDVKIQDVKRQDKIKIGTAIIEVTEIEKECHDTCSAITPEGSCGINKSIFFGRIVEEGTVRIGDEVKVG